MNYEDLAHLSWIENNNNSSETFSTNKSDAKEVINLFTSRMNSIDKYICEWYSQLPLEGMREIMGDYNEPDRSDYTKDAEGSEAYDYDLSEYIDGLYKDFSQVNLNIKMNDFQKYAEKYADRMNSEWNFIFNLDFGFRKML